MRHERNILKITKQYIIDLLNTTLFENTVCWSGDDEYNTLPLLLTDDSDNNRLIEGRGFFLAHKRFPWALRVLVIAEGSKTQKVCYRVTTIKEKITTDRICLAPANFMLDVSIADTNLGLTDMTSYSFYDNFEATSEIPRARLFKILQFLLSSDIYIHPDAKNFKDIIQDVASYPPIAGDLHYAPVYGGLDRV